MLSSKNAPVSRRTALLTLGGFAIAGTARARTVRISAKTLTGETLDTATLKGRPVLVQFWATWCTFCQSDEGAVESIVSKYAPKGLVVLGVNAYEPRQKVQEYLVKHPRSCKIALLQDTNLAELLTSRTYPAYVLYDRGGNVVAQQQGASGEAALRRLLQRAGL